MRRKEFLQNSQSTPFAGDFLGIFAENPDTGARREKATRSGTFFPETRASPAQKATSATIACFENSGSQVKVTPKTFNGTYSCTNIQKSAVGSFPFFPDLGTSVSDSKRSRDLRTVSTASATSSKGTSKRLRNAPAFESDTASSEHELERTAYRLETESCPNVSASVWKKRSFSDSERTILRDASPVSASDGGTGNPFSESVRQFSALFPMASSEFQNSAKTPFFTGTSATHSNSKSQSSRQTSQTLDATGKSQASAFFHSSKSLAEPGFLK